MRRGCERSRGGRRRGGVIKGYVYLTMVLMETEWGLESIERRVEEMVPRRRGRRGSASV